MYNHDGVESNKWWRGLSFGDKESYMNKTNIFRGMNPSKLEDRHIKFLWRKNKKD